MSWWVPSVLGVVWILGGDGEEGFFVDSWEAVLVEHFDVDLAVVVLSEDLSGVFFGVERVHQDQRDVRLVGLVQVLDLLNSQVQKVQSRSDGNHRLGSSAAHGSTETTVELDDDQLVEEGFFLALGAGGDHVRVWLDLNGEIL